MFKLKLVSMILVSSLIIQLLMPMATSAQEEPEQPQPQEKSAAPKVVAQMYLPLVYRPHPPVQVRKLVITQDAEVAAANGVATTTQCREFDPVGEASAAGVQSVCVTDYIGLAVVCRPNNRTSICIFLQDSGWFSSLWQDSSDENLPIVDESAPLSDSTYYRYRGEDGQWHFDIGYNEPGHNDTNYYAGPIEGMPEATWMHKLSQRHAMDKFMQAREGQSLSIAKILGKLLVMYSDPTFGPSVSRGTLWDLCQQQWPEGDTIFILPIRAVFMHGQVYVRIQVVTTAEGITADPDMETCMERNDAKWTTFDNIRNAMLYAEQLQLDAIVDQLVNEFSTPQMVRVGVGTNWGPNPQEVQDATFRTVVWSGVMYVYYLLASGLEGGATMIP